MSACIGTWHRNFKKSSVGGSNKEKCYHGDLCPENFRRNTRAIYTNELQGDAAAVSRADVEKGKSVVIHIHRLFTLVTSKTQPVAISRYEQSALLPCRRNIEAGALMLPQLEIGINAILNLLNNSIDYLRGISIYRVFLDIVRAQSRDCTYKKEEEEEEKKEEEEEEVEVEEEEERKGVHVAVFVACFSHATMSISRSNPFPAVGEEKEREAGFGPWREHRTAQSVGHLHRDTNGRKQAQDNGDWGLSRELFLATSTKRVSLFPINGTRIDIDFR
ncbi:hypothetical protein V1478_008043 [Vespula squamosa]|uniref:Uncharacterized protein n=1 Tax=Vespula squamosa TaxID=30214 RepID=A0ABD2AY18_VESSQ